MLALLQVFQSRRPAPLGLPAHHIAGLGSLSPTFGSRCCSCVKRAIARPAKIEDEPALRELGYRLQGSFLFKEVGSAGNDLQSLVASELGEGFAVEFEDVYILAADDQ